MWDLLCLICYKPFSSHLFLTFFSPTLYLTRLNYTTAASFWSTFAYFRKYEEECFEKSLLLLYKSLLGKGNCSSLVALCLKYSIKTPICTSTHLTKHPENERTHSGLWSCQAVAMCVSQDLIYEQVSPSQTCKRFKNMKFSERIKRITYLLALWGTV